MRKEHCIHFHCPWLVQLDIPIKEPGIFRGKSSLHLFDIPRISVNRTVKHISILLPSKIMV